MDTSDIVQLCVLVILLALSSFFSSAETALTTVGKVRVRTLVDEGVKNAATLEKVCANSDKMLSAILIGNNIVNLTASALTTMLAQKLFNSYAVSVATGILTILILIFGEITPKRLATAHAEKVSLAYAPIIYALMWLMTPFIYIINAMANGAMRLMGWRPDQQKKTLTESDLRTIVDVSHEEGIIETEEKKLIKNVFDLGDAQAKDIMIPRIDMTVLDVESAYEEILEVFERDKYTRFPVYEDQPDNIIGILNVKDLLLYDKTTEFSARDFLREPNFTYEYKHLDDLLLEMKQGMFSCCIVLDEYGIPAGLITLEDILEEIVGDIRDEYDSDEEDIISPVNPNEYIVSGQARIDDINDELNLNLVSEEYESLAGIVMEVLDKLPEVGDRVELKNCSLEVLALDKKRVDKILIRKNEDEDADEKTSDSSEDEKDGKNSIDGKTDKNTKTDKGGKNSKDGKNDKSEKTA
ncbi:MAG: hemolysin family protein [Lachnospiraceae bacterium]|nr:hemolysin family protein [Lachnospiraceae bacterium]